MRYVHSVIRFVPDPVRGEFVNVGVLVGSDQSSEWELRTVENQKRARSLDEEGLLPLVWGYVDDIARKLDQYTQAVQSSLFDLPEDRISEEWLIRLSQESRNVVQLSPPAVIVADDIDEAFDVLMPQFIVEPEARRFRFKKKHPAVAAVRRAYAKAGLRQQKDFEEGASVKGQYHKERFDFIVANGRAVQLAQTWSFQIPNQEELAEQVKAWSWTVKDVRQHGGTAETAMRHITVPADVDIQVVYVPPALDGPRTALDEALAAFKDNRVHPVESDQADSVGKEALRLVGTRIA
jgi:hypothetical protein